MPQEKKPIPNNPLSRAILPRMEQRGRVPQPADGPSTVHPWLAKFMQATGDLTGGFTDPVGTAMSEQQPSLSRTLGSLLGSVVEGPLALGSLALKAGKATTGPVRLARSMEGRGRSAYDKFDDVEAGYKALDQPDYNVWAKTYRRPLDVQQTSALEQHDYMRGLHLDDIQEDAAELASEIRRDHGSVPRHELDQWFKTRFEPHVRDQEIAVMSQPRTVPVGLEPRWGGPNSMDFHSKPSDLFADTRPINHIWNYSGKWEPDLFEIGPVKRAVLGKGKKR